MRELLLKGNNISNLPLRVVYYARVSTEKDEQLNSLNNQQIYFEGFINKNENWINAGHYIDEGLSAITTSKRENFQTMIEDGKNGKFDLIVTKEITRFARNTLDSIHFTRFLLGKGVAVLFLNDNINTLDTDSELRLTIMSAIAQEEVRRLSERIKFGHRQAIKNGVVMGNSTIYGFDKCKGKLVINENEAEMVRLIFNLYSSGDYSTPKIEKLLFEKGYRNRKGRAINRMVINHIISNPKYKGFYCGNKVKIQDMFTKKQLFLSEDEWIMYKDKNGETVPSIVDEATWERANEILRIRGTAIKERRTSVKSSNLFTGKIICKEHNTPFWLKARTIRGRHDNTWVCSHRIKNGKDSCKTYGIKESELTEITIEILNKVSSGIESIVSEYVRFVKKYNTDKDYTNVIRELEKEIDRIEAKKSILLDYSLDGTITKHDFKKQNDILNSRETEKKKELEELIRKQNSKSDTINDIFKFKAELINYYKSGNYELTPAIINRMIDRILVSSEDGETINLQFVLKTSMQNKSSVSCSGYIIKEVKAPQYYLIAETNTQQAVIKADGTTIQFMATRK